MSYCRLSSMDFACDIYAYEHVGGFGQIHVAGNRVLGDIPKLPPWPSPDATPEEQEALWSAYEAAETAQHKFLETAAREDIDLPYAGEIIRCDTLEEFKAKLLELRALGYLFPDRVLDRIDAEMAEAAARRKTEGHDDQ